MPLITPVALEPLDALGPVHFIALGGAGMSGIAAAYADSGLTVSGSDRDDSAALRRLADRGVTTYVGHDPAQLGDARTVVVSSAIKPDNVELAEARRRGLRVWHRSAALAALMLGRRGVAVAGTHGKTTTTGMIATMLIGTDADPGYVIGSPLATTGESAALGGGPAFVVEADESDGSFLQYPAEIVVVTNIEADHLDNWGTREAYEDGFVRLGTAPGVRTVIMNADDPRCLAVADRVRAAGKDVVLVGESEGADVRLTAVRLGPGVTEAQLTADGDAGLLRLAVPGRFNLANAAAAYAAGRALGLPGADLREALSAFTGTHRRFEFRGVCGGVRVYDDYAHHPTEVAAILAAARSSVPEGGRLVACFQPHLFSRTRDFADEFAEALKPADLVVLAGIYPAREDAADFPGVTSTGLGELAAGHGVATRVVEDLAEVPDVLAALVEPGDLVLTIGAGSVTTVGPALLARLGRGA
ncbi:UDP-N-acetylmuramate--L-alanine ligase [Propioniciclava coleopterorum]|uniref:UDP-N-acetylmuramate--L-alanine ligase n=1 Tax=Propioniciclava coleopterorum TaxID=2714937 RepID=A0A6G7Y8M3_9ACTN|nr:UDP-N-acetylmuramate--L-alanine ligase [Propioniciclava coleopterorum]QIK72967.1 UDP-N-acetylmuramate--L-alanine ligase [Propioniciclava coleopterorum]